MKRFNKQKKSCMNIRKYGLLNMGGLFLLGFAVLGCGQSLQGMAPIQPVHNIADAQMELETNPSSEVVVPAVPAANLANPILEKHGLETVGFRLVKIKDSNLKALTYIFTSPEYAYAVDDWRNFLTDWAEIEDQIELPTETETRKVVDVVFLSDFPEAFDVQPRQPFLTKILDGITVSISYWRRTDLDRKYNRGTPFLHFMKPKLSIKVIKPMCFM